MSPIKRMTSAFSSAGDRSSRVPGGDMPLQNLKSLYAESPDLPIFTRAVSPCPPRLPPAKPPLPGLLPLLHPCNKMTARGVPCMVEGSRPRLILPEAAQTGDRCNKVARHRSETAHAPDHICSQSGLSTCPHVRQPGG